MRPRFTWVVWQAFLFFMGVVTLMAAGAWAFDNNGITVALTCFGVVFLHSWHDVRITMLVDSLHKSQRALDRHRYPDAYERKPR